VFLSVVACSGTDTSAPTGTASAQPALSPANQPATQEADVTIVRITVDNRPITAQLADNPTAHDLADQLPLTLTFRDLNRVEKIAELPKRPGSQELCCGVEVAGIPSGGSASDDREI
jgi:hypothetical protein